jgi:hypothetical protein
VQSTKAKVISNIFQCEDGGTEIGTHKSLDQSADDSEKCSLLFFHKNILWPVLNNEKRGGLTVIFFERSRFQLFTLKLSNESKTA